MNPSAGGERWAVHVVSWSALAAYHGTAREAFVSSRSDLVIACMSSIINHTYLVSARIRPVSARIGWLTALSTAPRKFVPSWARRRLPGKARRGRMVNHVTEEKRSPAGWIRGQMGTKLREAVLSRACATGSALRAR